MPLHPQAAAHLAALQQLDVPPVHRLTVPEARLAGLGYLDLQRPARPVASVVTRFIPGPGADLPVRVYRPSQRQDSAVVLMLHGSGWVICNIDMADEPARALALDTGFVVVTVNYRKAPENAYPEPLDDCEAAFDWMVEHADELGIDPTRIAVVGDSAGGNLAAALCLRLRDRGGVAPAAQALLYPALAPDFATPSHQAFGEGAGLGTEDMRWFWNHYLRGQLAQPEAYAAPLLAPDLIGLPPAYIATAEYDVLNHEGAGYARRLSDAGVPVVHDDYAGMIHGFYWMDGVLDDALTLQRALATWLTATLSAPEE